MASALVLLLMVDPFGLSNVPAFAETMEERSDGFDAAVAALGLDTPAPSTPIVGAWDPLPDAGAIPEVPADAPAEDEELVVLTEEEPSGAAPAALLPSRMTEEDPPPTPPAPVEVDLGGLEVVVAPVSPEVTPATVLLRVAGEEETDQAGITGVLLDVTDASSVPATDPEVELTVSYSTFAGMGSGDWAARLQFVWVPDCDTAGVSCVPVPIQTVNNLEDQTVSATVPVMPSDSIVPASFMRASAPLPGRVMEGTPAGGSLAITAGSSSAAGDWAATSLSPTSSWGNSGSTGAFTWSLPIGVPSAAAGPAPQLGLSYSSAASDGRTPSTNNQSGTVGEGFGITEGYVERSYTACSQDEEPGANNIDRISGDLCWGNENATMMFNGSTVELIRDKDNGQWHPKHEDGTKVERLTGAWNSGQANEYWKVTTADGIQYFFGRGSVTQNGPALNSAWTVPVYGNKPGEPCYDVSFADSSCTQVWRWNLEYVLDPSGNTMTYYYATETNRYVYDVTENPDVETRSYISGGHVTRIEYGTREGQSGSAPAKVTFDYSPRCITNLNDADSFCSPSQTSTGSNHWLDTPIDLVCTSSTPNTCENYTPVFFDRTRLASLTTSTYDGTTYQPVDTWTLHHTFAGEGTEATVESASNVMLVLSSVTHTGNGGTATAADDLASPPFNFTYEFLDNRIATSTLALPLLRPRVIGIRTDSGAQISVNYRTECAQNDVPGVSETAQAANKRLCFPVKWSMGNGSNTMTEYFHKYVVDSIVESGSAPSQNNAGRLNTGSVATITTFHYEEDDAAWAKPTGAMVDPDEVTYSDFLGMKTVTTTIGAGADQSSSRVIYYRGTGDVIASADPVIEVEDLEQFRGQPFVSTTLNGEHRTSQVITVPAPPVKVAENTAGVKSTRIESSTTHSYSYDWIELTNQEVDVHETEVVQHFNANAQVDKVDDLGDVTTASDDICTTTNYATNTALQNKHILNRVSETRTVATKCDSAPTLPNDLISNLKTTYDDIGRPLRTERIDPVDGTGYILSSEILSYDNRGRPLQVSDALGNITTTEYVDTSAGLTQSTTTTSPDPDGLGPVPAFQTTVNLNPLTGQILSSVDANGRTTTRTYDSLGRLLTVRLPQHAGLTLPSVEHEYLVNPNGLNSILTKTLNADGTGQDLSVVLYDGLLRPFQTQTSGLDAGADHNATAAQRGSMVTHTYYNSAGRVTKTTGQWWAQDAPSATPVTPPAVAPSTTVFRYDGAGRVTDEDFFVGNPDDDANLRWSTKTFYLGATTLVVPPLGATPESTIVDARGRVIERTQYERDPDEHAAVEDTDVLDLESHTTTYEYDTAGQLLTLTNSEGTKWTYDYDFGGRQKQAHDPDGGTTTKTYDALDRVVTVENANADKLYFSYDVLGRKISVQDTDGDGAVRSEWKYDTAEDENGDPVLGQLASSTRIVGGQEYTTTIDVYDIAYRPLETTFKLPDTGYEELGSGDFTNKYSYTVGGQVSSLSLPAITGDDGVALGAETITTHYDTASMPSWMSGGFGWGTYVAETRFGADGRTLAADLGNTYGSYLTYGYEYGTNRLTGIRLDRQILGTALNLTYGYDAASNVISIKDQASASAGAQDNQCFGLDGLRRLQVAWTAVDGDCSTAQGDITNADVGGAQPYWTEYDYDDAGNRTEMVEHGIGSTPTTTSAYTMGTGAASPHQLVEVSETTAGITTSTAFAYDDAGNRTSRIGGGDTTTYSWDAEGELVADDDYTYVYDTSGNRIVRQSADATTVYLPGGQEVTIEGEDVSATRYYSFGGMTVAMRESNGLGGVTSLVSDRDGSVVAAIPNTEWAANSVARVYSDPFGGIRGDTDTGVPGDHRFLGATRDEASGLTLLGARYYDPVVGSFISVDPVLDTNVPAHLHGYNYGFNNPVTYSDASGLDPRSQSGQYLDYDGNAYVTPPPSTSWAALEACAGDIVCTTGWNLQFQAQILGGIAETLGLLVWDGSTLSLLPELIAIVTNWGGYSEEQLANMSALIELAKNPNALGILVDEFWSPIASDWENNPGHALGGLLVTVASYATLAIPAAGSVRAGAALSKFRKLLTSTACFANSFAPGTEVLMGDGSSLPIEDVELGDQVWAVDPTSDRKGSFPVTALIEGSGEKSLVTISTREGSVVATAGHPFWSTNEGGWVDAGDLEVGDQVLELDGSTGVVEAISEESRPATVHNLTVDELHTFFVLIGDSPTLVHNCGGSAAAAARDALDGDSWTWKNLTTGGSLTNIGTNATHSEFIESMTTAGWSVAQTYPNGGVLLELDGARWFVHNNASSYQGWSANYTPAGSSSQTLKIRLGYSE